MRRGLLGALAATVALLGLSASARAEAPFGVAPGSFAVELSTQRAGAHPDLRAKFALNLNDTGTSSAGGSLKNLDISLPGGWTASTTAVPTCPLSVVLALGSPCPLDAAVGFVRLQASQDSLFLFSQKSLVFNIPPYRGEPAAFASNVLGFPVRIDTALGGGDGELALTSTDFTEAQVPVSVDIVFWGVPADHNGPGPEADSSGRAFGAPSGEPRLPLMTNPSRCSGAPPAATITLSSWQHPDEFTDPLSVSPGPIGGCDQLDFAPTIEARPTTDLADSPSGLDFRLHMPQHRGPFPGADEVQLLELTATGGQLRLGFGGEQTGATGSGDLTESSTTVQNVTTATGAFTPGEAILGVGIAPGTTIAALGAGKITLSQPATATAAGVELSADLPFNPSRAALQSALETLPSIGVGDITVRRDETGFVLQNLYSATFEGTLGNSDVEQLATSDGAEALQGTATVSTLRQGLPGSPGEELATAQLKDAAVTLPAGLVVNPAAANGLAACSMDQVGVSVAGRSNSAPVSCPDASRLGAVQALSPQIGHQLSGSLYLATPEDNPFGSLIAVYLVIDDPLNGILIKLAGKVEPDPRSGQLTVSFKNNPQFPLEDLSLRLFQGPGAAFRTPTTCGRHLTTSTLTPWSSPEAAEATPTSAFGLSADPAAEGSCAPDGAAAPNAPSFKVGSTDPSAGAFSPFVIKLTRADRSQPIGEVEITLPEGLLGRLAGIPRCPEADLARAAERSARSEQSSPSCPVASRLGSVALGAGAGPDPFYATGNAYLAGPYKGAPLSLTLITPALAGPFDLGTVVLRMALHLDPLTAQIHAISDPAPTILRGIPLDVRSIALTLDRPNLVRNPTNCDPSSILARATSPFGQTASLSMPFQVGDCPRLRFKPRVALKVLGRLVRNAHLRLRAVLRAGPHEAAIAATNIALPAGELLDLRHLGALCARRLAPGRCPPSSRIGRVRVWSPLVDHPIGGPIYLRAPSARLPDLLGDLRGGGFHFVLRGHTAALDGRLRIRLPGLPDVPLRKALITLAGGSRGIIVNSEALCGRERRASVSLSAHNGNQSRLQPLLRWRGAC